MKNMIFMFAAIMLLFGCVAQEKLDQGADFDTLNDTGGPLMEADTGRSPLMEACWSNDLDTASLLLEKGADVNIRNRYANRTTLMWVSWWGKYDCVDLLVGNGADVNAKDEDGKTALMFAAVQGHFEIVQFLVENGADVTYTYANDTAADLARMYGHYEIEEYLKNVQEEPQELISLIGIYPLSDICFFGELELTEEYYETNISNGITWSVQGLLNENPAENVSKILMKEKTYFEPPVNLSENMTISISILGRDSSIYTRDLRENVKTDMFTHSSDNWTSGWYYSYLIIPNISNNMLSGWTAYKLRSHHLYIVDENQHKLDDEYYVTLERDIDASSEGVFISMNITGKEDQSHLDISELMVKKAIIIQTPTKIYGILQDAGYTHSTFSSQRVVLYVIEADSLSEILCGSETAPI